MRELVSGNEPFITAIIHDNLKQVRALLDQGADINQRGTWDRTPLFWATSLPMFELLLSRGADIKARESTGFDVLHQYLIQNGPGTGSGRADPAVVKRLLEAGIDVRARNADQPHLIKACAAANIPIMKLLLAAGAAPNGAELLWTAMKSAERESLFATLVDGGIDANARCTNAAADTTILTEVCAVGDLETAQQLLDRGADPNARGRSTPLAAAEESGNQVLVDLLLERGATPHRPVLPAAVTQALDSAERQVKADHSQSRLQWASVLLGAGFRAAAASEVAALQRRGIGVPEPLLNALAFEAPAGVRWTFAVSQPIHDGVAPRTNDTHFPGARVTDGVRLLPLVITTGAPCTACDEKGEQVCGICNGTGSYPAQFSDDDLECDERQPCSTCRGLKFAVTGRRLGKGSCKHPSVEDELKLGALAFRRCKTCGLGALYGPRAGPIGEMFTDFACALCGRFACACTGAPASKSHGK